MYLFISTLVAQLPTAEHFAMQLTAAVHFAA
jgi:hypothetical protein